MHLKRHHLKKTHGFRCPVCAICFSCMDRNAYEKHIAQHNVQIKTELTSVSTYINMVRCNYDHCYYQTFSVTEMQEHFCQDHSDQICQDFSSLNIGNNTCNIETKMNALSLNKF